MSEIKRYTVIVFTENKPGVLYRISDLLLRRRINIESLTVSEIEANELSRFTIVVQADRHILEKVCKQLYRIIEVIKVFDKTDDELVYREIALFKVFTKNTEKRRDVHDLVNLFKAKIVRVERDEVTIEQAGTEEEINALHDLLRPFGIKEYVRSGRIALAK